jgi:hypothetical protein
MEEEIKKHMRTYQNLYEQNERLKLLTAKKERFHAQNHDHVKRSLFNCQPKYQSDSKDVFLDYGENVKSIDNFRESLIMEELPIYRSRKVIIPNFKDYY